MLTLVTGVPGAGKTLHTLQLVLAFQKSQHETALKTDPEAKLRTVYQFGISGLKLPWESLESVERWHELPSGSIIVIDEAQQHFSTLGPSAKRPEYYLRFDTHRHRGHDVFLITQDSGLIDTNVRAMVGEHRHLVRPFGMSYAVLYKWQSTQNTRSKDCSKDTSAVSERWTYPKELFEQYKSAEVHTVQRRLPKKKLIIIGVTLVVPILSIVAAMSMLRGTTGADEIEADTTTATALPSPDNVLPMTQTRQRRSPRNNPFADLNDWIPKVPDLPASAPIYSSVVAIQDAPRVDGCLLFESSTGDECTCTDQQGMIVQVTEAFCRRYISHGFFDPTVAYNQRSRFTN